jgi:hypothetical protein
MLFWALMASGQIIMRKVDGWQTLTTQPLEQEIECVFHEHSATDSMNIRPPVPR